MLFLAFASPTVEERVLAKDGIGPISMSTSFVNKGGKMVLNASARNDAPYSLTRAEFCVLGTSQRSRPCLFHLWTNHIWKPGEVIRWDVEGDKEPDVRSLTVAVEQLGRVIPELGSIVKVYVERFEGNTGAVNTERIIAYLAVSPRFRVVENPSVADAIIRGRADAQEVAQMVTSSEHGATVERAGGLAFGTSGHSSAVIMGVGADKVTSSKESSQTTATVVAESLMLRLVVNQTSQIAWAWDDTKQCGKTKASCAVEDLIDAAGFVSSLP